MLKTLKYIDSGTIPNGKLRKNGGVDLEITKNICLRESIKNIGLNLHRVLKSQATLSM